MFYKISPRGAFIGMDGFGASAPAATLYEHFGITPSKVAETAKRVAKG
jgi:transketolase